MEYYDIFRGLEGAGVDYLIVGGLAVNLHGVPRMTYDVDLMVSLDRDNVGRLIGLLGGWGYQPSVPVDPNGLADPAVRGSWGREKNMRALCFRHEHLPIAEIDLVFIAPLPFPELKERAIKVALRDIKLPVISLKDLVAMKESAGREQDRDDAAALRKLGGRDA